MLAIATAALALSGSYKGAKSILGEKVEVELHFQSETAVDISISGVASVACSAETCERRTCIIPCSPNPWR